MSDIARSRKQARRLIRDLRSRVEWIEKVKGAEQSRMAIKRIEEFLDARDGYTGNGGPFHRLFNKLDTDPGRRNAQVVKKHIQGCFRILNKAGFSRFDLEATVAPTPARRPSTTRSKRFIRAAAVAAISLH